MKDYLLLKIAILSIHFVTACACIRKYSPLGEVIKPNIELNPLNISVY